MNISIIDFNLSLADVIEIARIASSSLLYSGTSDDNI
jgi:hypothetical protein